MRNVKWALLMIVVFALFVVGCSNTDTNQTGDKNGEQKEMTTLTVGASPTPHAKILEQVKPVLAEQGVDLKIVEYSDYVQPNLALDSGDLDANFFQHIPYMEQFASERKLKLQTLTAVHIEPMGIYSEKVTSFDELKNGDQVAIPNDASNGGRALLLLEKAGLIELKSDIGIKATVIDITKNPLNLKIVEMEAPILPRALSSVAISVINTNYALEAGLSPTEDALFIEDADTPYLNILTIREGEQDNEALKKLDEALRTDEVKKYIEDTFNGAILPAF